MDVGQVVKGVEGLMQRAEEAKAEQEKKAQAQGEAWAKMNDQMVDGMRAAFLGVSVTEDQSARKSGYNSSLDVAAQKDDEPIF